MFPDGGGSDLASSALVVDSTQGGDTGGSQVHLLQALPQENTDWSLVHL